MPAFWNNPATRHSEPDTPRLEHGREAALPAQPLERALDLDARTDWPTHRIRSFLSMHRGAQPGGKSR